MPPAADRATLARRPLGVVAALLVVGSTLAIFDPPRLPLLRGPVTGGDGIKAGKGAL